MRTLILSCNTGAGHNSCARAIQEVYQSRGETCDVIDALLFISKRASKFISNWHTRIYLHAPKFFSAGYEKAEEKDDLFREGTPSTNTLPPVPTACTTILSITAMTTSSARTSFPRLRSRRFSAAIRA